MLYRSGSAILFLTVALKSLACPPIAPGKSGVVSTPAAAIEAAKIAWKAVYDKARWQVGYSPAQVARFEPYVAFLDNSVWYVTGASEYTHGPGSPEASVCAADGTVEAVSTA